MLLLCYCISRLLIQTYRMESLRWHQEYQRRLQCGLALLSVIRNNHVTHYTTNTSKSLSQNTLAYIQTYSVSCLQIDGENVSFRQYLCTKKCK